LVIPGQETTWHPTIANWLKDYARSTFLTKDKTTRGTFEELTYINQSNNVRKLSKDERDLLLKILKLDDWLRYSELKYDFGINGQPPALDEELSDKEHKLIPEELVKILGESEAQAQVPVQPTPPALPKVQPVVSKPRLQPSASVSVAPKSPLSDFDKKLAQVAAPVAHGQDLEVLRRQLEPTKVAAVVKVASAPAVAISAEEIKRELAEPELPGHKEEIASSPSRVIQKNEAPRKDERRMIQRSTGLKSLDQITVTDDLKKVDLAHLRQGPVQAQTQLIKSKILSLASANKLLPYYLVNAFEQSPLFKAYLQIGSTMIEDENKDRVAAFKDAADRLNSDLSLQEFEAIADLRKEIERL
jgi:hypothetical protein